MKSFLPQAGRVVAAIALSSLCTLAAAAGVQRAFVASTGNDANVASNCSLALPCRSFAVAIPVVQPDGELIILDSAGYGTLTVTQSIKIIAPAGVYAGISASTPGTSAVTVNAAPGDRIVLRGLDINGLGALHGINIQQAFSVSIEKTSVANFTQDGGACIYFNTPGRTQVYVVDSMLRSCTTGVHGIGAGTTPPKPTVVLDNVRIEGPRNSGATATTYGVWHEGVMDVSVRNSTVARANYGVLFDPQASGGSDLAIVGSEILRTGTALQLNATTAGGQGRVSIAGSKLMIGTTGIGVNIGNGSSHQIDVADTPLAYFSNGVAIANAGAAVLTSFTRSQIVKTDPIAIDANATADGRTGVTLTDTLVSDGTTLIKTSGNAPGGGGILTGGGGVIVTLARSTLQAADTCIDHGFGNVQLDASRITLCQQSIVDNGGGAATVASLKNNFVYFNTDAPGPTYITPTVVPTK